MHEQPKISAAVELTPVAHDKHLEPLLVLPWRGRPRVLGQTGGQSVAYAIVIWRSLTEAGNGRFALHNCVQARLRYRDRY